MHHKQNLQSWLTTVSRYANTIGTYLLACLINLSKNIATGGILFEIKSPETAQIILGGNEHRRIKIGKAWWFRLSMKNGMPSILIVTQISFAEKLSCCKYFWMHFTQFSKCAWNPWYISSLFALVSYSFIKVDQSFGCPRNRRKECINMLEQFCNMKRWNGRCGYIIEILDPSSFLSTWELR